MTILCINIHIIRHHSLSYVMSSVCVFDVAFYYTILLILYQGCHYQQQYTNVYKSLM